MATKIAMAHHGNAKPGRERADASGGAGGAVSVFSSCKRAWYCSSVSKLYRKGSMHHQGLRASAKAPP